MNKLTLYCRINFSMSHSRLMPLCFERFFDREYKKTISVNEFRQLHQQSKTKDARDKCFSRNILDRIHAKDIREVVILQMDLVGDKVFCNENLLKSLQGKLLLESENEQLSSKFCETFVNLTEGDQGSN